MSNPIQVDLSGRRALVTGGARGIGEAISLALARCGANVAVHYRSSSTRAKELIQQFHNEGLQAVAVQADVSRPEECVRMVQQSREGLGGTIDILVNNAGGPGTSSPIAEMPIELWRDVLDLNLTSVLVCCREVLPGMKEQGWGRIINISSISGRSGGGPGGSPYAAAKAAVNSLTKSLAKEGGEHGVTANAVAPGVILTDIHQKNTPPEMLEQLRQNTLLKRIGQAEDVTGAVAFLASDDAGYITGEHLAINGGLRLD